MNKFRIHYLKLLKKTESWSRNHLTGLFIFNILIVLLLLLRSGGYFAPYFTITINSVIFISLLAAVLLIGARSSAIFLVAVIFWIVTAILRVLGIEVWAERTAIYVYQSISLGVALLIIQSAKKSK